MKLRVLLFAMLLFPARALADDQQFSDGAPITIQPDKAYILVRTVSVIGPALSGALKPAPILIRIVSDDELKEAGALAEKEPRSWQNDIEPNVVEPLADQPYAEKDGEEVLLIAVKPGTYVFGGMAVTNWAMKSTGRMIASLCMGTVKFEAKAGMVTDLGTILIAEEDAPTSIPELSNVVSKKPRGFGPGRYAVAIRPAVAADEPLDTLRVLPLVSADYGVVNAFPNYIGANISRLAPMPGVLNYDRDGNVIDLKAAAAKGTAPASPSPAQSTQSQ